VSNENSHSPCKPVFFKPAVTCKGLNCLESSSLVLALFSFAVFDSPVIQGNPVAGGKAGMDSLGAYSARSAWFIPLFGEELK